MFRKIILPIFSAFVWISLNEFVRNQWLLQKAWINHYAQMHLTFPTQAINGAVWGIWSLLFSSVLYLMVQKFTLRNAVLIGWINGFVLMWLVIGNLSVLPFNILGIAIPWSLFEVFIACYLIRSLSKKQTDYT